MLIINPGTEPVKGATFESAEINLKQLIEDSGQENITYTHKPEADGNGRYSFDLKCSGYDFIINVYMPGCELERVRKSEPFYSPRLYVDGSSWLWGYALTFIDFDNYDK